jgi:hypothetical protein
MNSRIINLTTYWLRPALAVAALVGLTVLSVSAADQKTALDPRADELLKRMGDCLGHAKFFSVSVEVWQDIQLSSGQRIQAGRTIDLPTRMNLIHPNTPPSSRIGILQPSCPTSCSISSPPRAL